MSKSICPICGKEESCTQTIVPDGYVQIQCQTLSFNFCLDEEFLQIPQGDRIRENALDLITEHLLRQKTCGSKRWHYYYTPDYTSQDSDLPNYINIAEKLLNYPTTVGDVANRALLNLAILAPHYGDIVFSDFHLSRVYFEHDGNTGAVSGVLSMLEDMELLKKTSDFTYRITAKGWEKIDALRHRENEIKQGFIAMSFSEDSRPIREAFKRAITEAGYAVYISDEKEHNNQIVPEMLYEIGRSKFAVVDVTYPNYGAYYEAGYAQALEKQVIICCRKAEHESPDKKKRPHFDIAQKPVIVWETEEELVEKLKRRIEATVNK